MDIACYITTAIMYPAKEDTGMALVKPHPSINISEPTILKGLHNLPKGIVA